MTDRQKLIAERIIQYIKDNNYSVYTGDINPGKLNLLDKMTLQEYQTDEFIVMKYLRSENYIKSQGSGVIITVTPKGEKFISFKNEEEKEAIEENRFQLEHEKLKAEIADLNNRLLDYDKIERRAKNAQIYTAISAFAAVAAAVIAYYK